MQHYTKAPGLAPAIGPYSAAVKAGDWLYISGQIALTDTGDDLLKASVEDQAQQVMQNLGAVLQAAGADYSRLVKCSIFLLDMADFAQVNAVYAQYLDPESLPARETIAVGGLPKGARVEISAVAYLGA